MLTNKNPNINKLSWAINYLASSLDHPSVPFKNCQFCHLLTPFYIQARVLRVQWHGRDLNIPFPPTFAPFYWYFKILLPPLFTGISKPTCATLTCNATNLRLSLCVRYLPFTNDLTISDLFISIHLHAGKFLLSFGLQQILGYNNFDAKWWNQQQVITIMIMIIIIMVVGWLVDKGLHLFADLCPDRIS